MGARVYDPDTGTFMQPDPVQGGGANAYGYTDGDPVNETDLSGDCLFCLSAVEDVVTWPVREGAAVSGDLAGAALDVASRGFAAFAILKPFIFPTTLNAAPCEMHNDCGAVFAKGSPSQSLPKAGAPNSTGVLDRGNGSGQIRDYGPNGEAQTDYDFGHDHNGAGDPHAHDWVDGVRGKARPL
jgi:hypothetical protein